MFFRLPEDFYLELKNPNTVLLQTNKFDSLNFVSLLFRNPTLVLTQGNQSLEEFIAEVESHVDRGFHAAGYLSYEAAEKNPRLTILNRGWFGIYEEPIRFDHSAANHSEETTNIESKTPLHARFRFGGASDGETNYKQSVETVLKHIKKGDTYQINLCGLLDLELFESPEKLYRILLDSFPAPYSSFVRTKEGFVISFSPELFFSRDEERILTAPMKGTAKRGRTLEEDAKIQKEFSESEKIRAENVMIVDLMRNDLTKVASNITVKELFKIEKFLNLFQMTSKVEGNLRSGTGYKEIFNALFPSGSVTGAPKISSMEIISKVEPTSRGVYTGAVGYIAPNKKAVFNVAIRTIEGKGDRAKMGVGGAIVWDSKPEEEFKECILKGRFVQKPLSEFSLFETILWDGKFEKLEAHLNRIRNSADYFDFCFESNRIQNVLEEFHLRLMQLNSGRAKVKLSLDRFGQTTLSHTPAGSWESEEIAIWPEAISSEEVFLFHKTTNRSLYNQAMLEARSAGLADYVFVNERGEVTEGAISNLFVKKDGRYFTPPVSCGLLAGVEREYLLETLPQASEKILRVDDLKTADEIIICNSVRGSTTVELLNGPPACKP